MPQLLALHALECALQQEKPPQSEARALQPESSPSSLQLQKAHTQQRRPNSAKNTPHVRQNVSNKRLKDIHIGILNPTIYKKYKCSTTN